MGLNKDQIVFNTGDIAGSDKIGSYIIGAGGAIATTTLVGSDEALDVNVVGFTAADVDIRDLDAAQDNVAISDGTEILLINADGSINVNLTDDGIADDAADSGNPFKVGSRAFFGAPLAAISTTGDRADLLSDQYRRLYVNDSANVGVAAVAVSASTIEEALPTLQGRKELIIQNLSSSVDVYVGPTGLNEDSGLMIPKRGSLAIKAGEEVPLYVVTEAGTADVRVFELA